MVQPPGHQEVDPFDGGLNDTLSAPPRFRSLIQRLINHHLHQLLSAERQQNLDVRDRTLFYLSFLTDYGKIDSTGKEIGGESVAHPVDLVDDCSEILAPLTGPRQIHVTHTTPSNLTVPTTQLRRILFHLLLDVMQELTSDDEILIDITYRRGLIAFSFPGTPGQSDNDELMGQLQSNGARLKGNTLSFPAAINPAPMPSIDLKAIVLANSTIERRAIKDRLMLLGVTCPDEFDIADIDLCVIVDDELPAYRSIRKQLPATARIWCIGQQMIRHDQQQIPVAVPVHQRILRQLVAELSMLQAELDHGAVLIVDDHLPNTRLLEMQLRELGHPVELASSGQEAIDRVNQKPFQTIFMDIQMPGLDGVETCRQIRLKHNCRIIGLTAHATAEERNLYIDEGMDDVLIKPIRLTRLRSVLGTTAGTAVASQTREPRDEVFSVNLALVNANQKPEVAEELLSLLIKTLPADQQEILDSLSDRNRLSSTVHRLHGAVRYSGTPRLSKALGKLETAIKKGDDEMIRQRVNLLCAEISALMTWYRSNHHVFRSHHRDATA